MNSTYLDHIINSFTHVPKVKRKKNRTRQLYIENYREKAPCLLLYVCTSQNQCYWYGTVQ